MDHFFCRICLQELKVASSTGLCKKCSSRENIKKSPRRIDIVGKRFGALVVRSYSHTNNNAAYWICECDCGKTTIAMGKCLKKGIIETCICLRKSRHREKHNLSSSRLYRIWSLMKNRCSNPKAQNYKNYGGRGISVCTRWTDSFSNFLEDMGSKPYKKSLDRINNNGNYCKENCRWATSKEQARNSRRTHYIEAFGKKQCIIKWAEETGINPYIIRSRIKSNWPIEKALTKK